MTHVDASRAFAPGEPGSSAGPPDLLLSSQQARRHQPGPETALAAAVLENAIECLRMHGVDKGRIYREAEEWFLVEEPDWPFSFERICAFLDLDPDSVRRAVGVTHAPDAAAGREEEEPPTLGATG
jgi:hypothetical protein